MVRTKVFVGNLSFKTTDKDLAKEFEVAGKVATANIISRGSRSLGYGFVEMESEEEAKKSVELLNKKTIDTREINVEIARPREERAPAPTLVGDGSAATGDATRSPSRRGGRRGGNRRPAGSAPAGTGGSAAGSGSPVPSGTSTSTTTVAGDAPPKRTRSNRRRNNVPGATKTGVEVGTAGTTTATTGGDVAASPSAPRVRAPRPPRAPRNDADRTPSTTTLFVANLPFTVDDAQLADLFKGLNIKAAHVVKKPNNNLKSKGFGFVEFNTQEDQLKALDAVNKKMVGERELSVKVALQELPRADAVPATDATTPAATLPATTAPGVAATAESK